MNPGTRMMVREKKKNVKNKRNTKVMMDKMK